MASHPESLCCEEHKVSPLFAFLGAKLVVAANGEAEIHMPIIAQMAQGGGVVAGGILATLADEAMAHGVLSLLRDGQASVTAEMNIRYLRSVRPQDGGKLIARGRVIKMGRNLATTEASVFASDERLLATAGGTFWVLPDKE